MGWRAHAKLGRSRPKALLTPLAARQGLLSSRSPAAPHRRLWTRATENRLGLGSWGALRLLALRAADTAGQTASGAKEVTGPEEMEGRWQKVQRGGQGAAALPPHPPPRPEDQRQRPFPSPSALFLQLKRTGTRPTQTYPPSPRGARGAPRSRGASARVPALSSGLAGRTLPRGVTGRINLGLLPASRVAMRSSRAAVLKQWCVYPGRCKARNYDPDPLTRQLCPDTQSTSARCTHAPKHGSQEESLPQ